MFSSPNIQWTEAHTHKSFPDFLEAYVFPLSAEHAASNCHSREIGVVGSSFIWH